METLKIQKEHQEKFEFYVSLPDELKENLILELKKSEMGLTPNALIETLSTKVPLSKARLKDIITILLSLLNTQKVLQLDNIQFAEILRETFLKFENNIFPPEKMTNDFLKLLSSSSSQNSLVTAKIVDLITDNQRIFIDALFNNDIRPIFLEESGEPNGAVVIHNLKITYRENGQDQEIYFSLDSNDLAKIKEKIDLAQKQLQSLKSHINLNLIEIK